MNHLYDPPADLNSYEVYTIGAALMSSVSSKADHYRWLRDEMPKVGHTPERIADTLRQEKSVVHNTYKVACRFVVDPLPWEFFEKRMET